MNSYALQYLYLVLCCWLSLSQALQLDTSTLVHRQGQRSSTSMVQEPEAVGSSCYLSPGISNQQNQRIRKPWKLRLLKRSKKSTGNVAPHCRTSVNVSDIDPWGVAETQSSMELPSWACVDETEARHLAAMKIVLGRDLEKLETKAISGLDGRAVKVVEAFPDVYSDFRLLRFLRKDTIQDPVTAAVRYREFLQWRENNRVDEIRLRIEERFNLGDTDIFRPPEEWSIVRQYLPYTVTHDRSSNGVLPVYLQVGEWDTRGITKLILEKRLSLKTFLGYWTYLFEAIHLHLYKESLRTKQMIFVEEICDLDALTMSQLAPTFVSHVLKPWVHLAQANYPETTSSIVFLKPPRVFSLIWKFLSPMFSRGTLAKVSVKR